MSSEALVMSRFVKVKSIFIPAEYQLKREKESVEMSMDNTQQYIDTTPIQLQDVFDNDLCIHTISISKTGIYGEGNSLINAYEDLVDNVLELYEVIDEDEINTYFKTEQEQKIVRRLFAYNTNKLEIKKALYLSI